MNRNHIRIETGLGKPAAFPVAYALIRRIGWTQPYDFVSRLDFTTMIEPFSRRRGRVFKMYDMLGDSLGDKSLSHPSADRK